MPEDNPRHVGPSRRLQRRDAPTEPEARPDDAPRTAAELRQRVAWAQTSQRAPGDVPAAERQRRALVAIALAMGSALLALASLAVGSWDLSQPPGPAAGAGDEGAGELTLVDVGPLHVRRRPRAASPVPGPVTMFLPDERVYSGRVAVICDGSKWPPPELPDGPFPRAGVVRIDGVHPSGCALRLVNGQATLPMVGGIDQRCRLGVDNEIHCVNL